MTELLTAAANVLHALATTVFVGYYLLMSLLYLPLLPRPEMGGGAALGRISKASRPWQYVSLLVLAVTGAFLTYVDTNYMGVGNFGSPWAILMLVKHVVIVAMIAVAFWGNVLQRVGQTLRSNPGDAAALARFRTYCNVMSVCGVIVLIVTAIAQVE
jgi:uncharacterized membrane protein